MKHEISIHADLIEIRLGRDNTAQLAVNGKQDSLVTANDLLKLMFIPKTDIYATQIVSNWCKFPLFLTSKGLKETNELIDTRFVFKSISDKNEAETDLHNLIVEISNYIKQSHDLGAMLFDETPCRDNNNCNTTQTN